jgi:hypothetical protein
MTDRRTRSAAHASRPRRESARRGPHRTQPFARNSLVIGSVAGALTLLVLGVVSLRSTQGLFAGSDGLFFLNVARAPFGNGHGFPGNPLVVGVAYRYGRVLLPLFAWLLALGRAGAVPWTLAVVFASSVGAWVALTAEYVRRSNRGAMWTATLLACPGVLIWFGGPVVVSEPLAISAVLLAYLLHEDGRERSSRAVAAMALLARETTAVAFIPLAWQAWRRDRGRGLVQWAAVGCPYAAWSVWVWLRVGRLPFADPAIDRSDAFVAPFRGINATLQHHFAAGERAIVIGVFTVAVAIVVVVRTSPRRRALACAGLASSCLVVCYGWAVWRMPAEALRVMSLSHALILAAAMDCPRRNPSGQRRRDRARSMLTKRNGGVGISRPEESREGHPRRETAGVETPAGLHVSGGP